MKYTLEPDFDSISFMELVRKSSDFKTASVALSDHQQVQISYFSTLIDEKRLQQDLIVNLQTSARSRPIESLDDIQSLIPMTEIEKIVDVKLIHQKLLKGSVIIQMNDGHSEFLLASIPNAKLGMRQDNDTENEFSVIGPKIGFIEDLDTNIHLMRLLINSPALIVKELNVGSASNSRVAILSIEGVTNPEIVDRLEKRLKNLDYDVIFDTSQLDQFVSDNTHTPFPLFLSTERRDRVVYALLNGQVAFMSDGSSYFSTGPSTLFDFFISPEDYFLPWILGSFFRIIRIIGVIFSVFASALYVATMTFNYEVIPHILLGPLIYSRINVPFPPVLEVLFLEFTIELLREAGARLPIKIGQTLGIVGGIIIGQAAVEAALTNSILIIIVSLSALASFTTPIYKMANTIRFLRFPIIVLAAIWGGLGIMIGVCFIVVHLAKLQSLGYPYTAPLYPFRPKDLRDIFIRLPYQFMNKRIGYLRPLSQIRYRPKPIQPSKKEWDED